MIGHVRIIEDASHAGEANVGRVLGRHQTDDGGEEEELHFVLVWDER